jgi:hypothetical protein
MLRPALIRNAVLGGLLFVSPSVQARAVSLELLDFVSDDELLLELKMAVYQKQRGTRPIKRIGFREVQQVARLQSFESDLCTLYPNKTWGHCCEFHDLEYWLGGSAQERLESDLRFRSCIKDAGAVLSHNIMYWGVRVGGRPPIQTAWRWGFGWNYYRPAQELLEAEKFLALRALERSPTVSQENFERLIQLRNLEE